MNTEQYTIQSSCGNYKRKSWLIRGPKENTHPLCLFLDAEHYIDVEPSTGNMNALSVIESLLKNEKVPSMTIVFVTHGSGATRHEDYTCNPQYAKYIADDIVKWQESKSHQSRVKIMLFSG